MCGRTSLSRYYETCDASQRRLLNLQAIALDFLRYKMGTRALGSLLKKSIEELRPKEGEEQSLHLTGLLARLETVDSQILQTGKRTCR